MLFEMLVLAMVYVCSQGVLEHFDDIVLPTGRGGTMCGIALGNYLTGSKVKSVDACRVDQLLE